MTTRRRFLCASGAVLAAPALMHAQGPAKAPLIGYLGNSTAQLEESFVEALRQGLRAVGLEEGRNLRIAYRWAEGKNERLPALAGELVKLDVNAMVTAGTPGTLAAMKSTSKIPIVMVAVGDAVGAGLVQSLAKPGGNVTGMATLANELEGKRLELLKQLKRGITRVAVLMNPGNPFTAIAYRGMQAGAATLHLQLIPVEIRAAEELEQGFAAAKAARADALIVIADRFLLSHRARIAEMALKANLPGMFPFEDFVREGGLMSYAPNYPEMYRRAGTFIDRILKGSNPGAIPVELPTIFELNLNMKTAKAIGLAVPPVMRMRADKVIE